MQPGEQMRIPEEEGTRAQPLSSKGNVSLERDTRSLLYKRAVLEQQHAEQEHKRAALEHHCTELERQRGELEHQHAELDDRLELVVQRLVLGAPKLMQ